MKASRQFALVTLLLMSFLTPAMACLVPDTLMEPEERACCQAVQNRCEQMGMPASHGCCQNTSNSILDGVLVTKTSNSHSAVVAAIWLTAGEEFQRSHIPTERVDRPDHSPPQSPPRSNSVLRI
jgi:hypothetical protein